MATQTIFIGNGATTNYPVNFPYSRASEIRVTVDSQTVPFTLTTPSQVTLAVAPAVSTRVRVFRSTDITNPEVTFSDGSVLTDEDLNGSQSQLLQKLQEVSDRNDSIEQRSLLVAEGDVAPTVPGPAVRANKVFGFGPTGGVMLAGREDFRGPQGNPGGNVMAIGLFTDATAMVIPVGVDLVQTSGYTAIGVGPARYSYDPAVNAAFVLSNPWTSFRSANGRGFRLAESIVDVAVFGAIGDGVTEDGPAIQRAFNFVKSTFRPGRLLFPRKAYKITQTLILDAVTTSIEAYTVFDFSGMANNSTFIKVEGAYTIYGNSYVLKGEITGNLIVQGPGSTSGTVAFDFNSPLNGSATHMNFNNVSVTRVGTAFQFTSRSYNQQFNKCEVSEANICFDWKPDGDDSDERITVIGGTYYNSNIGFRASRPAGGFYIYGASIDYLEKDFIANGGKIMGFGVHRESNRYKDSSVEATGDGGLVHLFGGWALQQLNQNNMTYPVSVGEGADVIFDGVITNNFSNILTPNDTTPTTWATGAGRFVMRNTNQAFQFGGVPARLHTDRSRLADGSFEDPTLGSDMIWRQEDVLPIRSRYGTDAPQNGEPAPNMVLSRVNANQYNGSGALSAAKSYGGGSAAGFVLMAVPVRFGEMISAGFRVRRDPARPGSGGMDVTPEFVKIDGQDQYGIPKIVKRKSSGSLPVNPATTGWTLVNPIGGKRSAQVPEWATHFILSVSLSNAASPTFLFDGMWADGY